MKQQLLLALTGALSFLTGCNPAIEHNATEKPQTGSMFTQYQSGEPVVRGTPLTFPADHGSHPKQGIEWWYVTGNLNAKNGNSFGVQWTLFRAGLPDSGQPASAEHNPWWQGQFYLAHFALQSRNNHYAFERFGRVGQVQITPSPFQARLDDWTLASKQHTQPSAFLPLQLQASDQKNNLAFAVDLTLNNSPVVAHGDAGYSQKSPQGNASYYYSLPFLAASGTITFEGKSYSVTGDAWLDREWSGGLLSKHYSGWDWFSLQSDGEHKQQQKPQRTAIMAFCLRDKEQTYQYCNATRITRTGNSNEATPEVIANQNISLQATQTVELDGTPYPVQWQLSLEEQVFQINAINPDSRNQLSFPYWEGRVNFQEITPHTGQSAERKMKGKGYAELTGY